jgi:6-phosphogluconolactonase
MQGEDRAPPQPRLSLTLPRLVSARLMIILASGAEKRRVLERALDASEATELPVRAILKSAPSARILWSA